MQNSDLDFAANFDRLGSVFDTKFGPLGPSENSVAPAREHDFHFFDLLFSRTLFEPRNELKMTPKMIPK